MSWGTPSYPWAFTLMDILDITNLDRRFNTCVCFILGQCLYFVVCTLIFIRLVLGHAQQYAYALWAVLKFCLLSFGPACSQAVIFTVCLLSYLQLQVCK